MNNVEALLNENKENSARLAILAGFNQEGKKAIAGLATSIRRQDALLTEILTECSEDLTSQRLTKIREGIAHVKETVFIFACLQDSWLKSVKKSEKICKKMAEDS